jgi:hypothetical protein
VRFHWTAENWLKAFKVVGGDSLDFRYDATGRLVRRDTNGVMESYFLWSGDQVFAEPGANGVDRVEHSYYPGLDRPRAIGLAGDTVYFAHTVYRRPAAWTHCRAQTPAVRTRRVAQPQRAPWPAWPGSRRSRPAKRRPTPTVAPPLPVRGG